MDPNTALARMRELVDRVQNAGLNDDAWGIADEMAEVFQGLDVWLTRKGALPVLWERP